MGVLALHAEEDAVEGAGELGSGLAAVEADHIVRQLEEHFER